MNTNAGAMSVVYHEKTQLATNIQYTRIVVF